MGRVHIRGEGFVTPELAERLAARPGVNVLLVQALRDTLKFATGLLPRLGVCGQQTDEEKQRIVALLMLLRLVEIAEATFILAAYGVRQELHSLFRIFLDAYFLVANVCSTPGFVPIYFRTDERERLKLMNAAAKYDDELFAQLNAYATADLRAELDVKIKQERIEAFNSFAFAQRVDCTQIYDSMYRVCSSSIHSSPRCLEEYVQTDSEGKIQVLLHEGDTETIHRVLFDTQYFLLKALRGVCDLFSADESATLDALDAAREEAM